MVSKTEPAVILNHSQATWEDNRYSQSLDTRRGALFQVEGRKKRDRKREEP